MRKTKKRRTNILIVSYLLIINFSFSQSIEMKGRVLDSLQTPLTYVNIIAEPIANLELRFAVTNKQGNFQMFLEKNKEYTIRVSYLGYKTEIINFKALRDVIRNFVLKENAQILGEVIIDAKLAINIKKDTITYQTDKFVTGNERKLKDVLRKLPSVEVDRVGNVTVQGKRVTKVLIENKQFFTGDSKLAVNNIPADAINEIEILDNYTDVAILKGLEDSDDMAMNIKLKENKKNFWFGDIEVGSGVGLSKRHVVHPSIFYYSPKTSVNFIGDLNNTGEKSFTFKDYLDFEGGYNTILLNPKAYFSKLNDDFSQFLSNQDFKNSKHLFGGASINQFINNKTDLIGYTLYSKSDNELESLSINEYRSNTNNLIENRNTTNNPKNNFIISKIGIDNTQSDGTKLKVQTFFKGSDNKNNILNSSIINNQTNFINTLSKSDNLDFKQDVEWYKNLSENHTISAIGNFNFTKGNTLINWLTNENVFQSTIPIINDSEYSIFKDKETTSLNFSAFLKHYWVLGNFIHLYTTGGLQNYNDTYKTDEYQQISDGDTNNFSSNNFGNDIKFNFNNLYVGSHLKFQKGKFTFKPGVFYHEYSRNTVQLDQDLQLNKNYILPEFSLKIDLKRSEKINIRYNRKVRFVSITKLLNNFTLTSFNSIYRGNAILENELYHQASIYYYKFSLSKKLNYNFRINYRKTEEGIKNSNILEDINYITQPILLENSDENINFSGKISKRLGRYKLSIGGNTTYANYLQQLNSSIRKNESESYSFNLGLKTTFSSFPNLEVNYNKSYNNYKTQVSTSKFENDILNLNIEYDFLKDFIFNLNYNYQYFNNKNNNSKNKNDLLNMSLFYQKENNPWGFEISANNLFDNNFIRNSSFNDFLITDNKKFVLPRIILLKLSYKL